MQTVYVIQWPNSITEVYKDEIDAETVYDDAGKGGLIWESAKEHAKEMEYWSAPRPSDGAIWTEEALSMDPRETIERGSMETSCRNFSPGTTEGLIECLNPNQYAKPSSRSSTGEGSLSPRWPSGRESNTPPSTECSLHRIPARIGASVTPSGVWPRWGCASGDRL